MLFSIEESPQAMKIRLFYVSNIRVPSEKANTYQVFKMCDAFSLNGADVILVHPRRIQTRVMRKIKDIRKYYSVTNPFDLVPLPALDFLFLTDFFQGWVGSLIFHLQNLTFIASAFLYVMSRKTGPMDIVYTRDVALASFFLRFRHLIKARICLETHVFREKWSSGFLRSLSGIVVLTRRIRKLIETKNVRPEKIIVAPDGVDLKIFRKHVKRRSLGFPKGIRVVGYVGRFLTMEKEKGIPELVSALALVKKSLPGVRLCCIGGPMSAAKKYRELASAEGLSPSDCLFLDQVPSEEIPSFLKSFDICAMPFPWSEHYAYFMSPLKMFEYMASGKPIIATDLPSIREVLHHGKNAYLVKPDNIRSLADGIIRVLENKSLAKRLGQNALKDIKRYDWSVRARMIRDCLFTQENR
jgi:glycosyltransferase involved in cell wall biosynthesis